MQRADERPQPAAMPISSNGTPPKKRKVRKGTQSCWECKRRKIRCTFAASTDVVCDGCKSRQTKCIGQEYQDDPPPTGKKADRLKRMESIIEDLVKQKKKDSVDDSSKHNLHDRQDSNVTASVSYTLTDPCTGWWWRQLANRALKKRKTACGRYISQPLSIPLGLEANTPEELTRYLLSFWPSQPDLDLIVEAEAGVSVLLHGVVCQPYEGYYEKLIALPRQILIRPTEAAHPVLVALKMLLLVTLLTSLPPASVDAIPGLSIAHRTMTERLYNAATKLVTSNNEFMTCVEGVESYLMETMYLANLGNLRHAWLVNRRAMDIAQMMGMHTGRVTSSIVVLEQETLDRIRPDYMWFRLVCADRHLSLLLGLPQATPENVFATPEMLETYPPMERFERILCVACSLILQRNNAAHSDLDTTYKIDKTLQRAATLLPPQWWMGTQPALNPAGCEGDNAFHEALRLMSQLIYHHLLVQLHLPYMLMPSMTDPRIDCSKITVANASRSILIKFISFHNSVASTSYCRVIDFIAFIASTTLCLVHIEARRQQYCGQTNDSEFSLLQPVLHQRLADRGILQRFLDIVSEMSSTGGEPVAKRIVSLLGPLLEIELNSYKGGCYIVSAIDHRTNPSNKMEQSDFGDSSNAPHILRIKIPFFGIIRIEHIPAMSKPTQQRSISADRHDAEYAGGVGHHSGGSTCGSDTGTGPLPTPTSDFAAQSQPLGVDWSAISDLQQHPATLAPQKDDICNDNSVLFNYSSVSEPYLLVPGLSSDDWALQGVDIALFSSLRQGS